jgi:hypothetical protein
VPSNDNEPSDESIQEPIDAPFEETNEFDGQFEEPFEGSLDIESNNATIDAMFDFVDVAEAKVREEKRRQLGIELHDGERL